MKILLISQYFPPEIGAPAARAYENASRWVNMGHDVTILCGVPNHPVGEIYNGYENRLWQREKVDGIDVIRTWVFPTPNRKAWERILNYSSFGLSSAFGSFIGGNPDIVIGTSPQLLAGVSAYFASKIKRSPFVFEVRDLWPESIEASGPTDSSLLLGSLRRLSDFLYKKSDKIAVVTRSIKDELSCKGVSEENIIVVPNGVDLDLFDPSININDPVINERIDKKFLVSYIGTHGAAHGLSIVLEAARLLEDRNEIHFLFVGEGSKKRYLLERKKQLGLGNVTFLDKQPKTEIPKYLKVSDASLVPLKDREVFKTALPSKMFESMAMKRPVLLGVKGEAKNVLMEAEAGIAFEPESGSELKDAIIELYGNQDKIDLFGQNGRNFVKENYNRDKIARMYIEELNKIVSGLSE